MADHITRRTLIASMAALAALSARQARAADGLAAGVAAIETRLGGRIGVAVRDPSSGRDWQYRADERFPLCSTFKLLAAAAILSRVDAKTDSLDRRIVIRADDLVTYSPITEDQLGGRGMTLSAICSAAVTVSDNTAGNLMLKAIDGPAGLTAFMRSIGDEITRLDRTEPTLNEAAPGDPRDTTSPAAMVASLERLLAGGALSPASARILRGWMSESTTGARKLRAGLPPRWRIGDKTGSGSNGTSNEVAVLYPPGRRPVYAAVYITGAADATAAERDGAIADIGTMLAQAVARRK